MERDLFKIYKDVTLKELLKNGLNSGNIISRILVNCTLYLLLCLTKFSINLVSDLIEYL